MKLRNIAIIAHVDHGKTTLVDCLLKQSGAFRENQKVAERAMDSNDIERERGITILAKCTSVEWKDTRINIIDTPGHADFGGEVERIISMVDGVLVLVDASEGPMPQTKFVLAKALKLGLKPIVVINKVDKPDQRAYEVQDEMFDLFSILDANEDQLDFPTLFASAKAGWAAENPEGPKDSMAPIFDKILEHVPEPTVEEGPFRVLATTLEANPFLGRLLTGRIISGVAKANMPVKALARDGSVIEMGRITKLLAFRGLERQPVEEAMAGDIVALSGLQKATVADTICAPEVMEPIQSQPIDPPTLAMTFSVNDSPLAGQEGDKVTSRMIRDRLMREAEGNVAIHITESASKDAFEVAGRGELQLAVLIENMRREGFELSISRPRVLFKTDPATGQRLEPIEEVVIDVDEEFSGSVVDKLSQRKAELQEMRPSGGGKQRLVFQCPSRGLIGYFGEFMTDTRGTGIMNRLFHSYAPYKGPIAARRTGTLISMETGTAVAYALWNLEDRGPMFIDPGDKIYVGMIIGEHSRGNDLDVNPLKGKQLTNMRASGKDEAVTLTTPIRMTLEKALAYVSDDELVEVTPESIRLRKRYLDIHERKRHAKMAVDA
ncbi:translational GTPase TypA [Oceanibaculum nanhaiense]|jgi:GTP-binding protein|uniref:translational GTPase TypA n=1 Tax=Oceanibaculum nanhaiense TaxID=1909734 RepID=UPI000A3A333C|nr:translational GTPase TypA [Oceanibaculum nanhaiense]MDM7947469.1 translational GTPase TypA [Oceanibaculum nanhaiense]